MLKIKLTEEEHARNLVSQIFLHAINFSEQIEEMFTEKKSFFNRIFSRDTKRDKSAEELNLIYHLFAAHLAVAEFKLETESPFNQHMEKVIPFVRQFSIQMIEDTFRGAGYEIIDVNQFVKEKSERLFIYSLTTKFKGNVLHVVMQNHELPQRILAERSPKPLNEITYTNL